MTRKVIGFLSLGATLALSLTGLPHWLLKGEVLTVMAFAAIYGFTAFRVKVPSWMLCQEFRGVLMVALGGAAMFIPAQFLISAWLVGQGASLVMNGFTEVTLTPATPLGGASRDLVIRRNGQVVKN